MIKLFIIDDEPLILKSYKRVLSIQNDEIEPYYYESAADALLNVKNIKPHFVFTDMQMPEIDGIDFIKRANKLSDKTVYSIISGIEISEDEKIDGVKIFDKPCSISELLEFMEGYTGST